MKKILFVILSLENGGAEKSLVNLLNEMDPQKYDIDLLLFRKKGSFLKQVPSYVNICDTPIELQKLYGKLRKVGNLVITKIVGTLLARIYKNTPYARAGYRWKNFYSKKICNFNKEYDVAFAYLTGESMFYTMDKINAKRKVCFVHNDYKTAKHSKEYDYSYFKKIDGIASISDRCCQILKEVFPEFSNKIWCIKNITSSIVIKNKADEFVPSEIKKDNTILSIGRLDEQKGFDMAISAASILKKRGVKFHWYIIGDGKLRKKIEEQIEKENVRDCFTLLGLKENPYPYIKKCTIFAQTSRYEGKSIALDEAKILAKPIISTNYPTVKDQIQNGIEGIIVEMSSNGIAKGIIKLLEDKELQEKLHKNLKECEYGNQEEIERYYQFIEGSKVN